jgi:hypothetical protein
MNKYIEKIAEVFSKEAGIGEVGKRFITTHLAPAVSKMSRSTASRVEGISRSFSGSKVAPRVFSTPEVAQHAKTMGDIGRQTGGYSAQEVSKRLAVATRAQRMGVDLKNVKIRNEALGNMKSNLKTGTGS